ncbi:MAG: tetratricopeptide repeat protein [Salinisphaera sp.]|nr:tetratricopeptide repeat protein [Salinisphaera sp.]MDN5937167.1 tetratricopeptide repeat protein [Salinisphaera sp.]
MAEPFDDDDDLHRLKEWWKANGWSLLLGVIAGLIIIGGWQGWQMYSDRQAREAAVQFAKFHQLRTAQADSKQLVTAAEALQSDHGGSPYAARAGLAMAAYFEGRQDYDQAIASLQWVIENGEPEELRQLARVRQARLIWAQGDPKAALAKLEVAHAKVYTPLYAELAGDIHAAAGDRAKARSAYQQALATLPPAADPSTLRRKIDNVAAPEKSS